MPRTIKLTGRYYRTIPMDSAALVEESIGLDPAKTALVAMHCWNIGCPDGPAVDNAFCVGMGFPASHQAAYRIMRERILPAMEAARGAGILVAHVESPKIGVDHPDLMEVPPTVTRTETEGEVPPPAVPGHRKLIADRAHGRDYPTRSPSASMDRASFLMPEKGEPFAVDSLQLHRMLHRRAIENLVYSGFATDMCVLHAGGGVVDMATQYSYRVFLIREATFGVEYPDWFDRRTSTKFGIRRVESHYGHSVSWDEWMHQCESLRAGGGRG